MNKKTINILYICLVLVALSCLVIFFFAWNSVLSINDQLQGLPLEHFHIDSCEINKSKIYINGWSFIPKQDHSITRLYAEIQGGKLLPISSNSVVREDISKAFGKEAAYRNSGFQASKRLFKKVNLNKIIYITVQSEDQTLYVAQYVCK